jgi:hypothetical protein
MAATATPTAMSVVPTATPTPGSGGISPSGLPYCAHNPTQYHGLVEGNGDGSLRCTYGHTHADNPHAVDNIFGPLPQGQEISYPWQTFNAQTGALENDAKHRVYDWMVMQNSPCIPSSEASFSIRNARLEYHGDGNMGATTRYHSYFFQGQVCDPADPSYSGIVQVGGWQDTGHLEAGPLNRIPLPSDPPAGVYDNLRKVHSSITHYQPDFVWYGQQLPPQRDGNASYLGVFVGFHKADWGPIDPSNPTRVLFFNDGEHVGGSFIEPFHVVSFTVHAFDIGVVIGRQNFTGFVDRYGKVVPNCSPVGLDCIPVKYQNLKVGAYEFRADTNGLAQRSYEMRFNGQQLIEFPN